MSGSLSLYWTVSGVEHEDDFYLRRNIRKPVLTARFQGHVGDKDAVLAYVGTKEISPKATIDPVDRSGELPANSIAAFSSVGTWVGRSGSSSTPHFLLTDIVAPYLSVEPIPFYWKHIVPNDAASPSSIVILDENLTEVDPDSYVVERVDSRDVSDIVVPGSYESCSIYSNYLNFYNEESGEVKVYFVRFEASDGVHYQMLNSVPAFSEATYDDVSLVTGRLKPWRKVYTIREQLDGYSITASNPESTYYLKPKVSGRIAPLSLLSSSDEVPWFPRITSGAFKNVKDGVAYRYSVPEYSSQSFSPLEPYKTIADELATRLRGDLFCVSKTPLKAEDSTLYEMDVLVKNSSGGVLYAFTTNSSLNGTYYRENGERIYRSIETDEAWVTWDSAAISSWDAQSGFIHLTREYPDTYYFYVSYRYKEEGYEYTSLNVNPVFDEEYDGQFYVLYVVPTGGSNNNFLTQTSSIQYLKVDRSGRIESYSQDSTTGNLDLADYFQIDGESLYYSRSNVLEVSGNYLTGASSVQAIATGSTTYNGSSVDLPSRGILIAASDDASSSAARLFGYSSWSSTGGVITFTLSDVLDGGLSDGDSLRLFSFRDAFSTLGTNPFQWLILEEVHIGPSSRVDELSIIDLRKPGGMIKESARSTSMAIDPRAIWARGNNLQTLGQFIPGESVAVVKIPFTLLTAYGGSFEKAEIEEIIARRHLATGIVPVIIYDGPIPNITGLTSIVSSITVTWDLEGGSNYSYRIYRAPTSQGPWTLAGTQVGEDAYANEYLIEGLSSTTMYYISVTSVDSDGIESPRGTVWGIKTRAT